jgi:tungstate transport system substrate-binding protein
MDRRAFLKALGAGGAAIGALAACSAAPTPPSSSPAATTAAAATSAATAAPNAAGSPAQPGVVRLMSVVIPSESGLYAYLLPDFEKRTGYKVEIATAQDVYGPARSGKADIVLSHYQHEGVSSFVQEGFGEWPRTVFASPGALIGPPADPAKVRGLTDVVDALARIAKGNIPFVVNDIDGLRYVAEVSFRAAAVATGGTWYVDKGLRGPLAMQAAAAQSGYTMWGVVPFLRNQQQAKLALEPIVVNDQILKSVMVTIVVSDRKQAGINAKGALALQQYLLEPATQAKVRTFRMAGIAEEAWWPAGQDNEKTAYAK